MVGHAPKRMLIGYVAMAIVRQFIEISSIGGLKLELTGKVHKYGANVDTDAIIPARYLNISDPDELAKHCMEGIDKDFVGRVKLGDFILAETNFGCG